MRERWITAAITIAVVLGLGYAAVAASGATRASSEHFSQVALVGRVVQSENYFLDTQTVVEGVVTQVVTEMSTPAAVRDFAQEHLDGVALKDAREVYSVEISATRSVLDIRVDDRLTTNGASMLAALEEEVIDRARSILTARLGTDAPVSIDLRGHGQVRHEPAISWVAASVGLLILAALAGLLAALLRGALDRMVRVPSDLSDLGLTGIRVFSAASDDTVLRVRSLLPAQADAVVAVIGSGAGDDLAARLAGSIRVGGQQALLVRATPCDTGVQGPTLVSLLDSPSSVLDPSTVELQSGLSADELAPRLSPASVTSLVERLSVGRTLVVDCGASITSQVLVPFASVANLVVLCVTPGSDSKSVVEQVASDLGGAELCVIT
ncbi:hypothetical protein [Sanguibacter sp. HDW7]|uniref:hypothetical protein n=1 Tax=Sanguibacter sp. HDW7 TaxID=2714931 RepID=UPI00140C8F37|nr:hypothetical protein [Sanguibacter sp. HDW7]QIK84269.1 hypothetical protein G7063_12065 [Sanguibacter sp. HDW7]